MVETLFGFKWKMEDESDHSLIDRVSSQFSVHSAIASLILKRVDGDSENVDKFLNGTLKDLSKPFGLKGLKESVLRLAKAVKEREKVLIHGDYDADGITSSALFFLVLKDLGCKPSVYIPNRLKQGHGVSKESLDFAKENKCSLLVTCDVGVSSNKIIDEYKNSGIDVIVTDHHFSEADLPKADAVFDPAIDSNKDFEHLAGVGVVFYLLISLRKKLREEGYFKDRKEPDLREHLDLVAMGTVADVSPMIGENRILVRHGVKKVGETKKHGIRSLLEISDLGNFKRITGHDIAFRLAPRINAAGRMGFADCAFDLLTTEDSMLANDLSRKLDRFNLERKKIEAVMMREAVSIIEETDGWKDKNVFCLARRGWHRGLLGLLAGKLSDKYGKTIVAISVDPKECRGSIRGIEPINVVKVLGKCEEFLRDFGGHALAGGFSLDENKIEEFSRRFLDKANEFVTSEDYGTRTMKVDERINIVDVNEDFIKKLEKLEPYGPMNTEPNFISKKVTVVNTKEFGANHARYVFKKGEGEFIEGVSFFKRMPRETKTPLKVDLVFTPEFNYFNGKKTPRLIVRDMKLCG